MRCKYYKERIEKRKPNEFEKGVYFGKVGFMPSDDYMIEEDKSYCIGTQEQDYCKCKGEQSNCDFHIQDFSKYAQDLATLDLFYRDYKKAAYTIIDSGLQLDGEALDKAIIRELMNMGYDRIPENYILVSKEEWDRVNKAESELQELYVEYYNKHKELKRQMYDLSFLLKDKPDYKMTCDASKWASKGSSLFHDLLNDDIEDDD